MCWVTLTPEQKQRLESVLIAATRAPGNLSRFRAAGLISDQDTRDGLTLVTDWYNHFHQLTPLSKTVIRQQPGQFLASVNDIVYRGATSGSRNRSYVFFAGRAWNQQRLESRRQFLNWWGIGDETPIITLASRLMPGRPADVAIVGALDQTFLDRFGVCVQALQQDRGISQPLVLRGYPSRLCELASGLNRNLPPIHAVITTGEILFPQQQALLEQVFQAPVINEYGCQEAAVLGMTCPEAGLLHLDERRCLYEVIDGALITTDLWNETMPLVRYQCGDWVRLDTTPCPCGRAGLTAEVLGRMEDRILTGQGYQPTAAIEMPPLTGVLHYRVKHSAPGQVVIWAQIPPAAKTAESGLVQWAKGIFGAVEVKVNPLPSPIAPAPEEIPWEIEPWMDSITQGSLGTWLSTPRMPMGAAYEPAQVLKALLNPQVIGMGMPRELQEQIDQLASSPIAVDERLEATKNRILLLACSSGLNTDQAQRLYHQVQQRMIRAASRLTPEIALDLLIPSLHLPPTTACGISSCGSADPDRGDPLLSISGLDTLNVYHLLSAFEAVVYHRPPTHRPAAARRLKPLLAVLIGDLNTWAPEFSLGHLAHWFALVQGQPAPWLQTQPQPTGSGFLNHWLQWRQIGLDDPQAGMASLQALQAAANTPQEQARVQIERGYHQILCDRSLDPAEWLPQIETHTTGLFSENGKQTNDLTPWMPIVQALIRPLHDQGQVDLAYRCLVATALSSRQQSAFERRTIPFNTKQSVLTDWSTAVGKAV